MTPTQQGPKASSSLWAVAIYTRLSPRPDGSYEGTDHQEQQGRTYAAAHWPGMPVRVFTDPGISAANGDTRPQYELLRAAIERGEVAHLWCVEQSRLERREVQWFELAALLDAAGITEVHTNRDGIVRVRDEVSGIKAVLAASEVRKLTLRVNDGLDRVAASGAPAGADVFGYRHAVTEGAATAARNAAPVKTLVIVPAEAEAIRWAADKILNGWSLSNVAAELRSRGLRGVQGGNLTPGSVRSMLTVPTIAGLRVHRGKVVGKGNWSESAILDEDTWRACKEKLTGNRTVKRADGGTYEVGANHRGNASGRRYVLTGLAVCGVCGAPLVGTLKQRTNDVTPYLICHPTKGGKSCIGIMLQPVEQLVVDALWAELDRPDFLDAVAKDAHAEHRHALTDSLRTVDVQREELAALWAAGNLSAGEWTTAREGLTEREHALRAELREVPPAVVNVDIAHARTSWPAMTLDERREFLRLFVSAVVIHKAVKGTSGFDPGRVTIEWRRR